MMCLRGEAPALVPGRAIRARGGIVDVDTAVEELVGLSRCRRRRIPLVRQRARRDDRASDRQGCHDLGDELAKVHGRDRASRRRRSAARADGRAVDPRGGSDRASRVPSAGARGDRTRTRWTSAARPPGRAGSASLGDIGLHELPTRVRGDMRQRSWPQCTIASTPSAAASDTGAFRGRAHDVRVLGVEEVEADDVVPDVSERAHERLTRGDPRCRRTGTSRSEPRVDPPPQNIVPTMSEKRITVIGVFLGHLAVVELGEPLVNSSSRRISGLSCSISRGERSSSTSPRPCRSPRRRSSRAARSATPTRTRDDHPLPVLPGLVAKADRRGLAPRPQLVGDDGRVEVQRDRSAPARAYRLASARSNPRRAVSRLGRHLALAAVGEESRRVVERQPARLGHLDLHPGRQLADPAARHAAGGRTTRP